MSRASGNEYPAGEITVRGYMTQVYTDDAGQWLARVKGVRVTAPAKDALKTAIGRLVRAAAAQVAVPFLAKEGPLGDGRYQVREGIAIGLHSGSRNVLVTWPGNGEKTQLTRYGVGQYLDGGADPAEWQRLLDEAGRTARELYAYQEAHKISLPAVVRDALSAAVAGETDSSTGDSA